MTLDEQEALHRALLDVDELLRLVDLAKLVTRVLRLEQRVADLEAELATERRARQALTGRVNVGELIGWTG